jgi:hypothetical protein
MIVKVYDNENKNELLEFKARKNAKNIIDKIKKELEQKYNCSIRRTLVSGKIDFASGERELSYILWGENLPCKSINYYVI